MTNSNFDTGDHQAIGPTMSAIEASQAAAHDHEAYTSFRASPDASWTGCDSMACDPSAPRIEVWTEDGELLILLEAWYQNQAPALIGRMFLAGIPFGVLREGHDITLTADPEHLERVVAMLVAAGADVRVLLQPAQADDLVAKLGVRH